MADFESKFRYDSDFSKVTADIKALVREATNANSVFAQLNKTAAAVKTDAARSFSAQAGFAGFKAQIVDLTGATEKFGQQLMRNKLTMREYFREAAQAYKKDSKARALAEREVRRAQSTVVGMGDVGGRRKGILLTPDALDMSKANTQLMVASKQYEIFNNLVQQGSTALVNWGKNTQWAGRQLTVGLTVPMGIFTGQALRAFAELDKQVTRFRKVYGSDLAGTVESATDDMISTIQTLGSEFAKQYGIASAETMALAADLAAAGFEGQKLATAVQQTTRMMVLGEVDRQEAMKATLSIQTAFNQSSKELAQSVDFLNQVENQTSASLQDLVEAIPKAGPVIQSLGGDVKDLSVLMTAMREGGIAAAEGANALKSGMASLISPTTKAIDVARQFGIDLEGVVKRNRGELMPMLIEFQDQLRGLDDFGKAKVIEEIFGKYQFARISALFDNLNQQGSQTVGMIKLMDMSADELAKKSYSELKAQENAPSTRLAAMQQQLNEQLIKVGADLAETLLPIMQGALDILSKIVDGFNNLPGPIKSFAKIIGGITLAAGPVLMLAGVFGNLIGNAIKFGMSIVNMFKKMTGHPVQELQILSDEELAAKLAADQLTGAYERQRTSVMELNAALDMYIANLREAAAVAPPGAVMPGRAGRPPQRRQSGGIIFAQNGVDSGGRINGYGGGDTVPAMLEPGEFVINKKSSKKYKGLLTDINQGKNIPGYTDAGMVGPNGAIPGTERVPSGSFKNTGLKDAARTVNDEWMRSSSTSFPKIIQELEALRGVAEPGSPSMRILEELLQQSRDRAVDSTKTSAKAHLIEAISIIEQELTDAERKTLGISDQSITVEKKQFGMTQRAEQYSYNNMIETLGRAGNLAKIESFDIDNRDEVLKLLRRTESPIEPREVKILDAFFKQVSGNDEMRKALNLVAGEFNGKQLDSALKFSDRMTGIILEDEAAMQRAIDRGEQPKGYSGYRSKLSEQYVAGQIGILTDETIEKATGLAAGKGDLAAKSRQIDELYRVADDIFSPLDSLTPSSTLEQRARAKVLIGDRIASVSEAITGKKLATSEQIESLRKKVNRGHYLGKTFYKQAAIKVGGARARQIPATLDDIFIGRNIDRTDPLLGLLTRRMGIGKKDGGLIKGYAKGGMIGGLLQILSKQEQRALPNATEFLQKGFNVSRLGGLELAAVRKKQTGLMHDTKMFRGGRYNWDAAEVGQTITIPGSRSWSTREDVADTFMRMNALGGEKRSAHIAKNLLIQNGIDPQTFGVPDSYDAFRVAKTKEEELMLHRLERMREQERGRKDLDRIKELQAQKKALMDSPYPSQESTLFGLTEPKQFEVANRQREIKELDRLIHSSYVDYEVAKEQMARRREAMRTADESPVIFEMVTPKGTQTLPVSDLTGRGRFIQGMGAMDEFEHLLTDGTMRIVKKYIDERGVKRIVGEFVGAKKFALGGVVPPKFAMQKAVSEELVATFGRMNPPTSGHKKLLDLAATTAAERGADFRFGVSQTVDGKKNPFTLQQKTAMIDETMSEYAQNLIRDAALRTPVQFVESALEAGYKKLTFVVGEDRLDSFKFLEKMGAEKGLAVELVGIARPEGAMSASAVRDAMSRGDVDFVASSLPGSLSEEDRRRIAKDRIKQFEAIAQKRRSGGVIFGHGMNSGGRLNGYGGGDTVPAMLEPGEFVINKQSSSKYAPLLENINKDALPGFAGGFTEKVENASRMSGGLMGLGMSIPFMPMMVESFKTATDPMTKALTGLGLAIQTLQAGIVLLNGAIKLNTMAQGADGLGGLGGMKNKMANAGSLVSGKGKSMMDAGKWASGLGGKGAGMAKAGGVLKQAAGKSMMAVGSTITRLAPMLFNPVTAALAIAGVAIVGGIMLWNKHLDELKKKAASAYNEATEMAKVYNIELKKTSTALKENADQARSLGMGNVIKGRGQVEKDYAKAVTKDYGDLITKVKEASTSQEKINDLTSTYASLITQGFSADQAKEITAEIARQAGATQELSVAMSGMAGNIKNAGDAMDVLVTSVTNAIDALETTEERVAALNGAYANLVRQAADNPVQFSISSNELIDNAVAIDPSAARQMMEQQLADAGYGEGSTPRDVLDSLNLTTEEGKKRAQLVMRGVALGLKEGDFKGSTVELEAKVNKLTVAEQAKVDLNKQMDALIAAEEKNIEATNKWANAAIDRIEAEKDALQDAHEKRMKQLEDEAEALQDRADLIRENSDFYIKQLEKEYDTEQYYQQQRDNAAGGLKSLAEGDIFGYLQSQMQASSDAAQFGREQAMQQIEDTRDSALKAIDDALKRNNDAQQAADDSLNKALENADDRIEAINSKRSKIIKGFQDIIDAAQKVKDAKVGEVTNEQLQKIENAGKEVSKIVPKQMEAGVNEASDMIVENFGTSIGKAVNTVAKDSKLTKGEAGKLLQTVLGIFTGTGVNPETVRQAENPNFGRNQTSDQADSDAANSAGNAEGTTNSTAGGNAKVSYYAYPITTQSGTTYTVYKKVGKGKWKRHQIGVTSGTAFGGVKVENLKTRPYNMGGKVMNFNDGSIVPGFGNSDTVNAMLTPGEFVIDRTATRRNLPVLQAMNAGATFSVPQLKSLGGKMGSESEINNNNINMPVNITINGSNLTIDQIKNDIYGELIKAKNMIANSIGEGR
jgi:TP901 family phage tail tape measure protein